MNAESRRLDTSDEGPPGLVAGRMLLEFRADSRLPVPNAFAQIVVGTVLRSRDTFASVCDLLEASRPAQAAMLCRPLFEDVVVGHWLVYNRDDPDWLVERFFRHRDAMALHQQRLYAETGWGMGPSLVDDPTLASRQNALSREFGGDARRDWWDPGADGRGHGRQLGLRGVVRILEDAAARHEMFEPRLAGGEEPLLANLEAVAYKWFTQFLHHTALGLPLTPGRDAPRLPSDPSWITMFSAFWMYAQQIYLLHDLYGDDGAEFDALFRACLVHGFGAPPDALH